MKLKLLIENTQISWTLKPEKQYVVGSNFSGDNEVITIPPEFGSMSDRHLSFTFDELDGLWYVEDLESIEGTYVNNEIITSAVSVGKLTQIKAGQVLLAAVPVIATTPIPDHQQVFQPPLSPSYSDPNPIDDRETIEEDRSQKFLKTSKVAALDTWSVLRLLWNDPANGLQEALITLGDGRAFNAGIALCVAYVLAYWVVVTKAIGFLRNFSNIFGSTFNNYGDKLNFSEHFRILLGAGIPVAGMIVVLLGIKQIIGAKGNYKQFTFITGVSLTPLTAFLLLLWFSGNGDTDIITLVGFFCFTTFILFLNTSLVGILRLSPRNALLFVPIIIVLDVFISRVAFKILY